MAYRVTYQDKLGKQVSVIFPTLTLAQSYGKTLRNPLITQTDSEVKTVEVTKCPEGSAQA